MTPSLNQGAFIEETICSVLSQKGDFFIDYIIMDGGSEDESLRIIEKYNSLLREGCWQTECLGITYRWRSEHDRGQADAINKGLALATGQILGWLNSDDRLLPGALDKVARIDWRKFDFSYGGGNWISIKGSILAIYPTFKPNRYSLSCKCTLCQPTVFFRKETFTKLGNLSLAYDLVFDYEYWLRGVFSGARFKRIDRQLADSRMYRENKSLRNQRFVEWEFWQVREKFYSKIKLNRILLLGYRCAISSITKRQEKVLFAALGDTSTQ